MEPGRKAIMPRYIWLRGLFLGLCTLALAFAFRMLEWPVWQNPEFRLGDEMLLATHDAYHWVAGAEGFEFGAGHPFSEMLRISAQMLGTYPAKVAFWLPAFMAALLAVTVFAWVWALGSMEAGVAAGVLASLAPGFLARTLLGFCDTDLVTLCFPLLMTLAPACWAMRYLLLPQMILKHMAVRVGLFSGSANDVASTYLTSSGEAAEGRANGASVISWMGNPLSVTWVLLLALSGILAWWTVEWHSMFPYLIRYNALLLACLILVLAPSGRRCELLLGATVYALPSMSGPIGLLIVPLALLAGSGRWRMPLSPWGVALLWGTVMFFVFSGHIYEIVLHQINAYLKHAGDVAVGSSGDVLVYPSVAQSIIEVQDLSFEEVLAYFHPWEEAAFMGLVGFVLVLFKRPGALFLLPLAALGLLSMKLGGRMVMFGAPISAIGLIVPTHWLIMRAIRHDWRGFWSSTLVSLALLALLGAPFVEFIPEMSMGPMLNRRHAEALERARSFTPEDAIIWHWWDWGYATHHFARRHTIADGAAHGGPSLYLPAAVFAAENPRFARQLIKLAAQKGNEPSNVFDGLDNTGAAALISLMKSPDSTLVEATGKQYIVTSFEMLRLGFWISTFGNWDFAKKEGRGSALSIVPQQISFRLKTGEVQVLGNAASIFASTINVFEDGKLIRRDYVQEWFEQNRGASEEAQRRFLDQRRNINFLFNRVTDEKLVMDESLYNTLMVQLLVCPPGDARFSQYFRLVYDNVFVRIYEVL